MVLYKRINNVMVGSTILKACLGNDSNDLLMLVPESVFHSGPEEITAFWNFMHAFNIQLPSINIHHKSRVRVDIFDNDPRQSSGKVISWDMNC